MFVESYSNRIPCKIEACLSFTGFHLQGLSLVDYLDYERKYFGKAQKKRKETPHSTGLLPPLIYLGSGSIRCR